MKRMLTTQMGNQGGSCPEVRDICEWIWNGKLTCGMINCCKI